MTEEERQLMKRFTELSERAAARSRWEYSDFLGLAEQDALRRTRLPQFGAPFALLGGYEGAERTVAAFGSEELCGYPAAPPFSWVKIAPLSEKFAEELTHRDFLGALMALGVKRETMGDIVLSGSSAWLLCLDRIAPFVLSELHEVRRTPVECAPADAPECAAAPPEEKTLVISSLRLDALISEVYCLSRSAGKELVEQQRVFLSGRMESSPAAEPKPGDIVSVRGFGRFAYDGTPGRTKKDRLRVTVRIY